MRRSASLLAFVTLFGCAITPPKQITKPDEVKDACHLSVDKFTRTAKLEGPSLYPQWESRNGTIEYTRVELAAVKHLDRGVVTYCVRFTSHAKDWRFFTSAYTSSGEQLKASSIDREVTKYASTEECLGIFPTNEAVEGWAKTGVEIKVTGKRGSFVFSLPDWYVKEFLSFMDTAMKKIEST